MRQLQFAAGGRPIAMPDSHSIARHMPRIFCRRSHAALLVSLIASLLAPAARSQAGSPERSTQVRDAAALRPPAGARVAIVEFVDLECPVCARTNPQVEAAAAAYKIPLVRHDLLIPSHAWSPIAAVNARWFDSKSKALGDQYRDQVFLNQGSLYNNPNLLRQFTEKFEADHHIAVPMAIDPQGKLADAVKADNALGIRTGIDHTPTVFVVASNSKGAPFIEVLHPDRDLDKTIDQAMADTAPTSKAAPAAHSKPVKAQAQMPAETAASTPAVATPAKPIETQPSAEPAASQPQAESASSIKPSPFRNAWLVWTLVGIVVIFILAAARRRRR
jgi:protein-disulfide isomerase